MYTLQDDKCKFGKAIPLPSYHHVHQVGGLISDACMYIKTTLHMYIVFPEIFHGMVSRLHDTTYVARDLKRSYIGRYSEGSIELFKKNLRNVRIHSRCNMRKGLQFCRNPKKINSTSRNLREKIQAASNGAVTKLQRIARSAPNLILNKAWNFFRFILWRSFTRFYSRSTFKTCCRTWEIRQPGISLKTRSSSFFWTWNRLF